jgi:hypothetical protein
MLSHIRGFVKHSTDIAAYWHSVSSGEIEQVNPLPHVHLDSSGDFSLKRPS